jgi:hypothetical protein
VTRAGRAEPVTESVREPGTEPVTGLVREPGTEPVTGLVREPVAEPAIEALLAPASPCGIALDDADDLAALEPNAEPAARSEALEYC